jgi:hypothetical protein
MDPKLLDQAGGFGVLGRLQAPELPQEMQAGRP